MACVTLTFPALVVANGTALNRRREAVAHQIRDVPKLRRVNGRKVPVAVTRCGQKFGCHYVAYSVMGDPKSGYSYRRMCLNCQRGPEPKRWFSRVVIK